MPPYHVRFANIFWPLGNLHTKPYRLPQSLRTRSSISSLPSPDVPLLHSAWSFPIWGYFVGTLCVLIVCIMSAFICSALNRGSKRKKRASQQHLEDGGRLVESIIEAGERRPGEETNANWNRDFDGAGECSGRGNGDAVTWPKKARLVKARLKKSGRALKHDVESFCSDLRLPGENARQARRQERKGKYRATSPLSDPSSEEAAAASAKPSPPPVGNECAAVVVEPEKTVTHQGPDDDQDRPSPGELVASGVEVTDFALQMPERLRFGGLANVSARTSTSEQGGSDTSNRTEAGPSNWRELRRLEAKMLKKVASDSGSE